MNYCYGEIYEGEWLNDEIKGKGILKYEDNHRIEGVFINGITNCIGKIFKNGYIDEGEFINYALEGYGK
jgi:hypothetical protein